jgi:hypothetical protein
MEWGWSDIPEASRSTLLSVLERSAEGKVIFGGQYWDAIIWTTGAWAYYLYTGDRDLLALAFEATQNSLARFEAEEYDPHTGLFRGPACYGDGVGAYPDVYAQTNGSSSILDWPRCNPDKPARRVSASPCRRFRPTACTTTPTACSKKWRRAGPAH